MKSTSSAMHFAWLSGKEGTSLCYITFRIKCNGLSSLVLQKVPHGSVLPYGAQIDDDPRMLIRVHTAVKLEEDPHSLSIPDALKCILIRNFYN